MGVCAEASFLLNFFCVCPGCSVKGNVRVEIIQHDKVNVRTDSQTLGNYIDRFLLICLKL